MMSRQNSGAGWNNYGVCPWCTGHLKKSPTTELLKCTNCGVTWFTRGDGKLGLWDDSHMKPAHMIRGKKV